MGSSWLGFIYVCGMEVVKGGDAPKQGLEHFVAGFKYVMEWDKVKAFPKYNPLMFVLARNLDGLARYEFAKRASTPTKRYTAIEKGEVAPTDEEFQAILKSQTHVIDTFFGQWPETEIDWSSGIFGKPVAIDYYRYKVFRDLNPPRMGVVK